jgi:predicted transcriptional regulator of viral defense system
MPQVAGIGRTDRERLAAVLRGTKGAISVAEVTSILSMAPASAAKVLARWTNKGWLSRVRRGLYVPVPIESRTADVPLEDPWIIAARLYSPCYIGGWSAAEHWDLTEQIFRTVVVMTNRPLRKWRMNVKGTDFLLRSVSPKSLFGLKLVWRGKARVDVSDPTRTVLDMLSDPHLGGGIRPTFDVFTKYIGSEKKDLPLLIDYADRLGNGAVFKRLGFLLERSSPEEETIISQCRKRLTTGNAKLDPQLPSKKLIGRWRLWVPERWTKE